MATRLGDKIHGLIRTLGGKQWARMPGMSGLPTGLAATLRAATAFALAAGEPIGGRRLRGRRRILLTQCELPLQIGDALGLRGNLALAFGCAFATGLVFGYMPARKAAGLDPVVALASE